MSKASLTPYFEPRACGNNKGVGSRCTDAMLYYALVFLLVALLAGAFGFFALAGTAAWIAKILFVIFVVVFLVSLITGRRPSV